MPSRRDRRGCPQATLIFGVCSELVTGPWACVGERGPRALTGLQKLRGCVLRFLLRRDPGSLMAKLQLLRLVWGTFGAHGLW